VPKPAGQADHGADRAVSQRVDREFAAAPSPKIRKLDQVPRLRAKAVAEAAAGLVVVFQYALRREVVRDPTRSAMRVDLRRREPAARVPSSPWRWRSTSAAGGEVIAGQASCTGDRLWIFTGTLPLNGVMPLVGDGLRVSASRLAPGGLLQPPCEPPAGPAGAQVANLVAGKLSRLVSTPRAKWRSRATYPRWAADAPGAWPRSPPTLSIGVGPTALNVFSVAAFSA